jgi:hypothetical protein
MNTELHQKFMDQFHSGELKRETESSINECQNQMNTVLPESYCSFMKNQGVCFSPDILDLIDDDSELWPLQNIESLPSIVETTKVYQDGGMPQGFIIFASDCMGNVFCFNQTEEKQADAPVYFYDHDFDEMSKVADSFDEWLKSYLDLTGK